VVRILPQKEINEDEIVSKIKLQKKIVSTMAHESFQIGSTNRIFRLEPW
jgi:hypothetical protein